MQEKVKWSGTIVSVQPRSSVWRYRLDNRTHSLHGYNLFLEGSIDGQPDEKTAFSVAISETQQKKLQFQIGDTVSGTAWSKMYDFSEYADYYRAGALKILQKGAAITASPPPYVMLPPDLATYEWRGARMLSTACYKKNVSNASGHPWQMLQLSITGVSAKNTVMRASATAPNPANIIRWESHVLYLISNWAPFMTRDGLTRYARRTVEKMNRGAIAMQLPLYLAPPATPEPVLMAWSAT